MCVKINDIKRVRSRENDFNLINYKIFLVFISIVLTKLNPFVLLIASRLLLALILFILIYIFFCTKVNIIPSKLLKCPLSLFNSFAIQCIIFVNIF